MQVLFIFDVGQTLCILSVFKLRLSMAHEGFNGLKLLVI